MNANNKLRIQVLIQTVLLAYTGGTISWMHKTHLFVQPLIFFCTIDFSWSKQAIWILLFAAGLDTLVFASSLTLITRCLADVNPSCIQQSLSFSVIIAAVHIILDAFQVLNLPLLRNQNINPSIQLRIITWFLFVQDICWTITSPSGLEWGILAHPVFNMFVFWISSSKDPIKFYVVTGISALLCVFDTYILLQQGDSYTDLVASGLLAMYIFTDLMYAFFSFNYGEDLISQAQQK
jgi:hypothetical protein